MNISTSNHSFRSLALVAVCLLGTATAGADSSVTVSISDLDLSTPFGAATLYHRIEVAAERVCVSEGAHDITRLFWQGRCVRATVNAAVAKVNNPLLTALHTGHSSPAVTAMNK